MGGPTKRRLGSQYVFQGNGSRLVRQQVGPVVVCQKVVVVNVTGVDVVDVNVFDGFVEIFQAVGGLGSGGGLGVDLDLVGRPTVTHHLRVFFKQISLVAGL